MRRRGRVQRGQAILEMALLVPVAVGLFALALQGGLVVSDQVALQHYALDGALYAEHNPSATLGQVQDHIHQELCAAPATRFCLTGGNLVVTITSSGLNTAMRPRLGGVAGVATGCNAWHLAAADFSLPAGLSATDNVVLTDDGGGSAAPDAALTVSGLPAGVTAAFAPATQNGAGTAVVTLTAVSEVANGTYTLSFGGQDQCGLGPAPGPATAVLTVIGGSGAPLPCASTPYIFSPAPAQLANSTPTTVVFPGRGFTPATDTVTVGTTVAPVNVGSSSATSLSVNVPAIATNGVYNLTVTTAGGCSGVLANAITVGAAASNPVAPSSTNGCDTGNAPPEKLQVTITWTESLVVPWFTSGVDLTATQFAYCEG